MSGTVGGASEKVGRMTLTEFLLARIAEDEAAAKAVPPLDHNFDMGGNRQDERWVFDRALPSSADGMGNWSPHRHSPTTREHFSRHDPERVLAECEAKRRIVEDFKILEGDYRVTRDPTTEARRFQTAIAISRLAEVHADHPDFDEAWRA